jgi:Na+-driven multidrug efflux pump
VGAGRYDRVKKILWNCFGIATAVGIIMGFGMYALGRPLLSIYTSDPEDIACGMIRLQAILLTYFLCGEMETVVGVLRGLGYAVVPTIVSLVGACGFRLVWIATAFRMHTTLFVLFISYPISWIVTTIAHFICYAYAMHEIKKRRERAGT